VALAGAFLPPAEAPGSVQTALGRLVVLDGDTLRLPDNRRVRLPSVDAPELGRPFAEVSRSFTRDRVASGSLRLVPDDPPRDRYGRLLADVLVDGESLSEALLAAGLATLYDDESPHLVRLQAAAVAARVGMHARLDRARRLYAITAHRFHRPDCPWVRGRGEQVDVCAEAADALAAGRSPCRTCLAWPP